MKICEVNSGLIPIPADGAGAVEKIILSLSTVLGKLGHEVHIVDVATKTKFVSPENIFFRRMPNLSLPNRGISHLIRGIYFMFAASYMVWRLICEDKVDIIHIHNQFSGFLITILNKFFWKIPLVFTTHNQEIFEKSLKNTISTWPERYILRNAGKVVCVSPTVQDLLISMLGIDESRLVQIYSGVELDLTRPKVKKENEDQFNIITVARIVPRKNQLMVIKAAREVVKQFPLAKFKMIGPVDDDAYFDQLKNLTADYGLEKNVMFSGEVSNAELDVAYSDADLFVLTSTNENQGLVILEAMARSVPVICSSIGPFIDMVSREEGSAIVVNDESTLADAIIKLMFEPVKREVQIKLAMKLVLKLGWDNIGREYEELFRKLTTESY